MYRAWGDKVKSDLDILNLRCLGNFPVDSPINIEKCIHETQKRSGLKQQISIIYAI